VFWPRRACGDDGLRQQNTTGHHVDRRETARGVTERYVYDNGRVVLHNGIVTFVQISGTLR